MNPHAYIVTQGLQEPYIVERELKDTTWAATVQDIANMQFKNLRSVIEVGTGKDVTAQAVREAADLRVYNGADPSHEFGMLVELALGTRAARPFLRAA